MSEQAKPKPPLTPARRSKKLVVTVVILAMLPLVLPVPFLGLDRLWIEPVIAVKIQACPRLDCPDIFDWDRLGKLLILGPSIMVSVASVLMGIIGLIRIRRRPTASENRDLFQASVFLGMLWILLLGCILWYYDAIFIYL